MKGRVWRYGDHVNTDLIISGRYLDDYDPRHLARHALEDLDPVFSQDVRYGDIIVAGKKVGVFGEVHPAVLTAFELEHPVAAFELDLRAVPGYPAL